jgi:hypothetical protein
MEGLLWLVVVPTVVVTADAALLAGDPWAGVLLGDLLGSHD